MHSVSLFVVLIIWSKWAFSVVGTWSWETSLLSVNVGHSVKRFASTSWRSPREVPITRRDSKNSNVPIKKIMKRSGIWRVLFTVNRYRHCLSFCLWGLLWVIQRSRNYAIWEIRILDHRPPNFYQEMFFLILYGEGKY